MITIEAIGKVSVEGELVVKLPATVPPGEHRVVVVVDTAPETRERPPLRFSAYPAAPTSPHNTFRREDIYDEDGR